MTYKCETCKGTGDDGKDPHSTGCEQCWGSGYRRCAICQVADATTKIWLRDPSAPVSARLLYACAVCFSGHIKSGRIVAIEPDQEPRTTETACCFRFPTCDVMGTRINDEPAVTLARLGQFESWSPGQAMAIAAAIVAAARFAAKPN